MWYQKVNLRKDEKLVVNYTAATIENLSVRGKGDIDCICWHIGFLPQKNRRLMFANLKQLTKDDAGARQIWRVVINKPNNKI